MECNDEGFLVRVSHYLGLFRLVSPLDYVSRTLLWGGVVFGSATEEELVLAREASDGISFSTRI